MGNQAGTPESKRHQPINCIFVTSQNESSLNGVFHRLEQKISVKLFISIGKQNRTFRKKVLFQDGPILRFNQRNISGQGSILQAQSLICEKDSSLKLLKSRCLGGNNRLNTVQKDWTVRCTLAKWNFSTDHYQIFMPTSPLKSTQKTLSEDTNSQAGFLASESLTA